MPKPHVVIWARDERGQRHHAPEAWVEKVERVGNNLTALVMRPGFNGPRRLLVDLTAEQVWAQLRGVSGDDEAE